MITPNIPRLGQPEEYEIPSRDAEQHSVASMIVGFVGRLIDVARHERGTLDCHVVHRAGKGPGPHRAGILSVSRCLGTAFGLTPLFIDTRMGCGYCSVSDVDVSIAGSGTYRVSLH